MPSDSDIFTAIDRTWAPAQLISNGIWTIRDGQGGGQRVSAASSDQTPTPKDVEEARAAMADLNQPPLFMVKDGQVELDEILANLGYAIKDPVDVLTVPSVDLAARHKRGLHTIFAEFPMPLLAEIWAQGGIGPARLDVMRRVTDPKVYLMGRHQERPCAAAFVAVHGGICLAHAVEVLAPFRRQGIADRMMAAAAWWGLSAGAQHFAVLTTQQNSAAQRLYRKMGMETTTRYHYRVLAT